MLSDLLIKRTVQQSKVLILISIGLLAYLPSAYSQNITNEKGGQELIIGAGASFLLDNEVSESPGPGIHTAINYFLPLSDSSHWKAGFGLKYAKFDRDETIIFDQIDGQLVETSIYAQSNQLSVAMFFRYEIPVNWRFQPMVNTRLGWTSFVLSKDDGFDRPGDSGLYLGADLGVKYVIPHSPFFLMARSGLELTTPLTYFYQTTSANGDPILNFDTGTKSLMIFGVELMFGGVF